MLVRVTALALLLAAATIDASAAASTMLWKKVSGWDIRIDKSVNFGCFMVGIYERGDVLRVGIDQKHRNGYVLLANPKWRSLEVGKEYDLVFRFEGNKRWHGVARARKLGRSKALLVRFSKAGFLANLAGKRSLLITHNHKKVVRLSLRGTYDAVLEVVRCQSAVEAVLRKSSKRYGDSRHRGSSDPFADGTPARESDPFR